MTTPVSYTVAKILLTGREISLNLTAIILYHFPTAAVTPNFRWMPKILDFFKYKESFFTERRFSCMKNNVKNPFLATYLCRTAFLIHNATLYINHWMKMPYKQK